MTTKRSMLILSLLIIVKIGLQIILDGRSRQHLARSLGLQFLTLAELTGRGKLSRSAWIQSIVRDPIDSASFLWSRIPNWSHGIHASNESETQNDILLCKIH